MAAGSWIVSAATYAALTGAPSSSGWNVGKYWMGHIAPGMKLYERRRITLPGLNNIKVKKYGSRGRSISGKVVYISTTYTALMGGLRSDCTSLENTEFSVTVPEGDVFANCELVSFEVENIYLGSDGKYLAIVSLAVFSLD